ncbi:hypothetical protein UFOVP546_11 [uncultured Caudovirales phage]|uniref:Uncharacterized protein n=1 Tax=uncultured Caudovirales phage TaxID=2100421 RepID=A0A6J5MR01_9CAUD|nr:hypothetical protein UFOVP546_11 [uncultured Caudovirales phage]
MTKAKRLLEVVIATGLVFGMTAIGFRIDEPALGLFAAIPVWLYFKADFTK